MIPASELLREVGCYTFVVASTLGLARSWTRDQAVIGGNMVRLFKLIFAFQEQTCQKRRETSVILGRLACETAENVRYLISNFSPALMDSYIRHSLRHERKLWDRIHRRIAQRGGDLQPIETRMLNSLERTARIAGVSLESIDPKDTTPWGGKPLHQKAQAVGLGEAYDSMFGGLSHYVHGSWQDLYEYHLEADAERGFMPKLKWRRPRPQLSFALGTIVVEVTYEAFEFIACDAALAQLGDRLTDLHARTRRADEAHEIYLSKPRPRRRHADSV